jgi:hypothetical protein
MFRGKSSLSTGLSVGAAFTGAADTAGTSAHTTFGENKVNEVVGGRRHLAMFSRFSCRLCIGILVLFQHLGCCKGLKL